MRLRPPAGEEEDDGLGLRLAPVLGMWLDAVRSTLGLRSMMALASSFFLGSESRTGDCLGEFVLELGEKLAPLPTTGVFVPEMSLARSLAS